MSQHRVGSLLAPIVDTWRWGAGRDCHLLSRSLESGDALRFHDKQRYRVGAFSAAACLVFWRTPQNHMMSSYCATAVPYFNDVDLAYLLLTLTVTLLKAISYHMISTQHAIQVLSLKFCVLRCCVRQFDAEGNRRRSSTHTCGSSSTPVFWLSNATDSSHFSQAGDRSSRAQRILWIRVAVPHTNFKCMPSLLYLKYRRAIFT